MIPVDGHVHFHTWQRVSATLSRAAVNFQRHSTASHGPHGLTGMLLLAQAAGETVYEALPNTALDDWQFTAVAGEPQTCLAGNGSVRLAVVCGRQVRAQGGIEVLALGTMQNFDEGLTLRETVAEVNAANALAVVPWGFGKWTGRRGAALAALIRESEPGAFFLGDNGGRPAAGPAPALLRTGAERGFQVLPGSDPFPFDSDVRRVGSFGFYADVPPTTQMPWHDLAAWLRRPSYAPRPFGAALGLAPFVINQLRMHWYNRRPRLHLSRKVRGPVVAR